MSNPFEGDFTEVIQRGAFARAVRQNPRPVVQFDHGHHPLVGSIPIGALNSMREDDHGLYVSATVHDNWLTKPVRDAITSGAISGMSFRFTVPEGGDNWSDDRSTRTVTDVNLFELGPVVWPAYTGTSVSLRSQQLREALEDETVRADLAVALLLDNTATTDSYTLESRADEESPPAVDIIEADQPEEEGSSAPNPARQYATSFAVRAALAAQRSNQYEPRGLPDER